ncbi:hypothetical protein A9Q81_12750 [Gammaproteobacteria bacterium 42_54_T18]|nr:hypothetical protein A9Q81_12750 [Gammaproteobacteria bacterium 42_54_T18]
MLGFKKRQVSPTPKDLKIIPREIKIDLEKGLKDNLYWMDGDPVKTHFMNALQSSFPEGERMFIDSARDVRDQCSESIPEELNQQIKLFIRQEAIHGAHHEDWNNALIGLGYTRLAKYSAQLKSERLKMKSSAPAIFRLAVTAAGEHFTAITARLHIHGDPEFLNSLDRPVRDLILYHALEEIEHKAVCFDLFEHAGGNYLTRMLGAVSFSLGMMLHVRRIHVYLLKKDGLWNKENKKKARQYIWGREGLFFKLLPDILDYFKPSFHPWDKDDRKWLAGDFNNDLEEYGIQAPVFA